MIFETIQQMIQGLKNLSALLTKGQQHAETIGFDVDVLLQARLAPDMFHLVRQIQTVSDTAKFTAARLSGQEAPSFEDTETTYDELQARIQKTVEYLSTFEAGDFGGASERHIHLPFIPDRYALGTDYLTQFALPNFYFHLSTAYAILRHNGVSLGKRDFIGHMTTHPDA